MNKKHLRFLFGHKIALYASMPLGIACVIISLSHGDFSMLVIGIVDAFTPFYAAWRFSKKNC